MVKNRDKKGLLAQKVTRKRSDIDIIRARLIDLGPITVDPVRENDQNLLEQKRDRGRGARVTGIIVIGDQRDDLGVGIDLESGRIGLPSLHALEGKDIFTLVSFFSQEHLKSAFIIVVFNLFFP